MFDEQIIENHNILIFILTGLIVLVLIVINIVLFRRQQTMEELFGLFSKDDQKNLKKILTSYNDDLRKIKSKIIKTENIVNEGLYKVGLVKYNKLEDKKDEPRFSIAFLNKQNQGIVVTGNGNKINTKAVHGGLETLSPEEKSAIKSAQIDYV